mmetsp:Transcript_9527/g.20470  ORF Transcript_9527/g.20470 Transcript_9527/m.20470 type:complete len:1022 (+) Transcript_9527:602-3667(+)
MSSSKSSSKSSSTSSRIVGPSTFSAAPSARGGMESQQLLASSSSTSASSAATQQVVAITASMSASSTAAQQVTTAVTAKLVGSRYDSTVPRYTATSSTLSDDVYLTILSYIPTLSALSSFAMTCRRIYGLWTEGGGGGQGEGQGQAARTYREVLLERMFQQRFGEGTSGCSWGGVLTSATTSTGSTGTAATTTATGPNWQRRHWQTVWEDRNRLKMALTAEGKPRFVTEGFNGKTREQMCQLIKAFTGGGGNDSDGDDNDDGSTSKETGTREKAAATGGGNKNKRKRGTERRRRQMRTTIGILTEREEDEAIYYDNPTYAPDSEGRYCFGYFGMAALNTSVSCGNGTVPGAEADKRGPPVAVWGDFLGVRIFDSPNDVLYDADDDEEEDCARKDRRTGSPHVRHPGIVDAASTKQRKCTALAHADGEGLVLFALTSPFASQQQAEMAAGEPCPCLFLAMSSGMVISIGAATSSDGVTRYSVLSSVEEHDGEVTSLALVRNPAYPKDEDGPEAYMVASCGVDGRVRMYRNVFDPKRKFLLEAEEDPRLSCTYSFNCGSPLYSIASAVVTSNKTDPALPIECKGNKAVLVATGNEDGSISIWGKEMSRDCCAPFEHVRKYKAFSKCQAGAAGTTIIVSRICFINNGQSLITGSNHGDVRLWNVRLGDLDGYTSALALRLGGDVCLHVRHRMPAAHVGAIDSIENYGDLIFTSGGLDGLVRGWDLYSGRLLGVLSIHPGRLLNNPSSSGPPTKKIMSSVVGTVLLKSGSLISLCRDGTLHKWDFKAVATKYQTQKAAGVNLSNGTETDKDWLSSFVSPAVAKGLIGGKKKQKPRSLAELKRVMTKSGRASQALQQKMRLAIFKASVAVALQPDRKDMPFLGADGKLYESTKKAFSRYSGLAACASCRAVAQGAFYCRLVRAHELSPSSLAEVRNLLKVNGGGGVESKSSKRAAQDMTSSLSMLENITEDETKSTESKAAGSEEEDDEWQCHQCRTSNDADDMRCTTCWASKKKILTKTTTSRRN